MDLAIPLAPGLDESHNHLHHFLCNDWIKDQSVSVPLFQRGKTSVKSSQHFKVLIGVWWKESDVPEVLDDHRLNRTAFDKVYDVHERFSSFRSPVSLQKKVMRGKRESVFAEFPPPHFFQSVRFWIPSHDKFVEDAI